MSIESEAFAAVMGLSQGWSNRNQQLFPAEVRKKRIGDTGDLEGSFLGNIRQSGTTIYIDQSFDDSGRFVDMGVGRGHSIEDRASKDLFQAMDGWKAKYIGRRPKKWYRIFYARLNALQGAIGIRMMEKSVEAVKDVR